MGWVRVRVEFRPCGSPVPGVFLVPLGLAYCANSFPNRPPGVSKFSFTLRTPAGAAQAAAHGGMRAAKRTLHVKCKIESKGKVKTLGKREKEV